MCGEKRHTKEGIRSKMSELICGRIAAGENYNLTRDNNGLITDRKQPRAVISNEIKWNRIIQEGRIEEIRKCIKEQIDNYNLVNSNSIDDVIGEKNEI